MNKDKIDVENLLYKIDELCKCKYLLADKKVGEVLKVIASSKMLCDLFAFCSKEFDYEKTKRKCFLNGEMGKNGRFVRPEKDSDFIALVFLLLYDFDMKNMDLLQVAYAYFYDRDLEGCYRNFCNELILPFKEEIKKVTDQMFDYAKEQQQQVKVEKVNANSAVKPETADKIRYEQVVIKLLSADRVTLFNLKIDDRTKSDLMLLLDTFESAVYDGEKDAIRYAFVAYKYAVTGMKKIESKLPEIEKILVQEGIY
mgnify:FL=1